MITEYIKRQQRMGFDKEGKLVYKTPLDKEPTTEKIELDNESEED